MLNNLHKNCMGTLSFDAQFAGMRKPQDFIVYPMKDSDPLVKIQSDTRIGVIDVRTGVVILSKPRAGGAYFVHLQSAPYNSTLSAEELLMFRAGVMGTASGMAGNNGIVYCDNSGALNAFPA